MKIYTMGFKGKSQEEFIKTINKKTERGRNIRGSQSPGEETVGR